MALKKFQIIDELKERFGSRYLMVLLASRVAKIISDTKQEEELKARLGIPEENVKPTILALHKVFREGVKYYIIEEERRQEEAGY
jgi:DNA-directed RNA polymerase omega subunit